MLWQNSKQQQNSANEKPNIYFYLYRNTFCKSILVKDRFQILFVVTGKSAIALSWVVDMLLSAIQHVCV